MLRVTCKGGVCLIITNGIPEKRLGDLHDFLSDISTEISYKKVELSKLSSMINIMRSKLQDKPLSAGIKDPAVLKATLEEMVKAEKLKKEEALLANPKTKMLGMMLKAKRLMDEKKENQSQNVGDVDEKDEVVGGEPVENNLQKQGVNYAPKRQDFCMVYAIRKL